MSFGEHGQKCTVYQEAAFQRETPKRRLGYHRCVCFSEQLEGATGVLTSLVFHKETHANENVSHLFSICFQRQILKADHAKRNHAHREEIHSVVVKIPTTIPMANPLPRYSHSAPWYSFCCVFLFSPLLFLSLLLCLGGSFQFRVWLCYSQLSAVPVPRHLPSPPHPPLRRGGGWGWGRGSAGILISQQKDFPPPCLACWVKDRWLSAHVIEAEIS